ncbi:hypothetical protein FB451DRAFT_1362734 [Mycena latifolia]|nr:hypothetical protein FB451DRAFT_1362734 [Mycena latifolia]
MNIPRWVESGPSQGQGGRQGPLFVEARAGPGMAEGSIADNDKSNLFLEACTDQQAGRRARALLIDARHGLMDGRQAHAVGRRLAERGREDVDVHVIGRPSALVLGTNVLPTLDEQSSILLFAKSCAPGKTIDVHGHLRIAAPDGQRFGCNNVLSLRIPLIWLGVKRKIYRRYISIQGPPLILAPLSSDAERVYAAHTCWLPRVFIIVGAFIGNINRSTCGAALDNAIDRLSADGQFDGKTSALQSLAAVSLRMLFQGEPWGTTGNLFSQMAEFDIATNQTKYENVLEQHIVNYGLSFGHAAAKAYTAYKNPIFRQYAVESWWDGRAHTLSDNDVSSGKIAGKNFSISKTCANMTMVGGTFWDTFPMEPRISGIGTGYFLVISALLAETTSDPMYLQAAVESAGFIGSHLYNVENIVQDYISAGPVNNTECQVVSSSTPTNSGLMIEGLAILSSITKNSSTQKLLNDLIVAVIPDTSWQGDNGVIATSAGTGDMNLLQGLGAAYTRNLITPELRQYVGAYIAVQFNAVTDLATSSGTNIYGGSWTGPSSAEFSGVNQTMALAALISALGVSDSVTPSSSSSTAPSGTAASSPFPSPNPSKKRTTVGAILGGVLGGVAITAALGLWLLRRHHSRAPETASPNSVEPFMTSTVNSLPVSSPTNLRLEKRGLDRHPPATSSGIQSGVITGEGSSAMNSSSPPPGPELDRHPNSTLPTEALVELLNQRLRNRQWDDGETPPDYPVTGVGSR